MSIKIIMRKLVVALLLTMLISVPVISLGCQTESTPSLTTSTYSGISSTLVPNINFDVYVYGQQDSPTTVPKDLIGLPFDVVVESLALWGIPVEDDFILGGGFTLTSAADAAKIHSAIPRQITTWTMLSERTIYFVQGSGVIAESLKETISNNDFKYYDDQEGLQEVSLLPAGGATKLVAVGIVEPGERLTELIAKNITPEASGMVDTLLKWVRLQVITVGLYAPRQISVAEIAQSSETGSFWQSELGILASVKSSLPGFVVNPILNIILDNAGYTKTSLGEVTIYKGSADIDNGKAITILVRMEGNRIFAAVSGQESYAETLVTGIKK